MVMRLRQSVNERAESIASGTCGNSHAILYAKKPHKNRHSLIKRERGGHLLIKMENGLSVSAAISRQRSTAHRTWPVT